MWASPVRLGSLVYLVSLVCLLEPDSPDRPDRPAGSYALRITMAAYFSIMLSMFLGGSERGRFDSRACGGV
jgi:hypothetical protein